MGHSKSNAIDADYVTAEIKGENEIKRRTLKKGALIAVTVISVLYIFLNFVMVDLILSTFRFIITSTYSGTVLVSQS